MRATWAVILCVLMLPSASTASTLFEPLHRVAGAITLAQDASSHQIEGIELVVWEGEPDSSGHATTLEPTPYASPSTPQANTKPAQFTLGELLFLEAINTGFSALVFVPNGSKVVAVGDGLLALMSLASPMDYHASPGENVEVPVFLLAAGFAAMAAANWGTKELQLTDEEKFAMNVIGPHVAFGLYALSDWILNRKVQRNR